MLHEGQGPRLSNKHLGQKGGNKVIEITGNEISTYATANEKSTSTTVVKKSEDRIYKSQPCLGLHYIIALIGIYPSRN